MTWIKAWWRGQLGLARVFWLHTAVAAFAVLILGSAIFPFHQARGALLGALVIAALFIPFAVIQSVGVWRSAGSYAGPKVWAFSARAVVVLAATLAVFIGLSGAASIPTLLRGFKRNSHTVAATIVRDGGHPFAGFWKSSCTQDFGFAVEPASAGTYSVVFCGPGGCFPPGTYRPDTTLVGDPAYRIVDANTIEIQSRGGFERLLRCQ